MENKKNDDSYNNESYLDKRIKSDDVQNINALDEIRDKDKNKGKDKGKDETKESISPPENISNNKSEDDQKEMHPEIVRKKNKDFTMPLVLGVVVLIVIGALAIIYLIPLINIQKKESPQQIIKSAMQEMQKVKTYNYNGIIEFDIEDKEDYENFNLNLELSGKTDQTDINNAKSFGNLKVLIDASMDGGSQEFSFDLDTVQLGQKKVYLKVNDFDLGMIGMMIGPKFGSSISSLKENWYKLDIEELEQLNATSTGDNMKMPTYDINKIMALYNKYELLKFEEDLGDIKMGGFPDIEMIEMGLEHQDFHHYKVKLDGIALANLYMDVIKEMITEIGSENKDEIFKESDKVFKKIQDGIEEYDYVINKVADKVDIEVWIGKDDKFIYRTKIYGEFDQEFIMAIRDEMIAKGDIPEEDVVTELDNDEDVSFAFYADIKMSDFNQPVKITEPEEAENLMEVLEEMLGGFFGAKPGEATIRETTDTDGDGLPDYLETVYGSDPNNPDTDGDGYKDGEEVEGGYDPVVPGDARLDYDKLFKT